LADKYLAVKAKRLNNVSLTDNRYLRIQYKLLIQEDFSMNPKLQIIFIIRCSKFHDFGSTFKPIISASRETGIRRVAV
jgi:hypothetical protein